MLGNNQVANSSRIEHTKPVIIDLINSDLTPKEVANELNHRRLYMASGASWNAGRINHFLIKHQIGGTSPSHQP